jgi:LmbE family N-acetylglucosaminyl deacetylase
MTSRASERIESVVAVEGHPDDVELGCLGTLLKLRATGTRITIVSVTTGGQGASYDPGLGASIADVRFGEATAVAERLGGEFVTLGAPDGYLYDTPELRNALAAVLRRARPQVVFAPPPVDYHLDHATAGRLAFSATYYAATAMPVEGEPLAAAPALYYYDSIAGVEFTPSFLVDISDQIAEKKELAALHASQMANMRAIGGWDLVDHIEVVGRFRGLQGATAYAEAFQACLRWPRGRALHAFPF